MPTKMAVWRGNGLIRKETPHPLLFMVQHPFSALLQYLPARAVTTTVEADSGGSKLSLSADESMMDVRWWMPLQMPMQMELS